MMTTPSADEQIRFLHYLQTLLDQGEFTATYKFALLLALADLSVELEPDPNTSAVFRIEDIASKFIQYYWRQTPPYPSPGQNQPRTLFQNSNSAKEAKVLMYVREMQREYSGSLGRARSNTSLWNSYCLKVARVIEVMPLTKLQTIGREGFCFLYDNPNIKTYGGNLILKPGVAFFLRRFHTLIRTLVQDAWARRIREYKANQSILGHIKDLQQFLFGVQRQDLGVVKNILREVQEGRCFYCEHSIGSNSGDVDHFVPWSKYSVDLGHNFVLAHNQCNTSKCDFLPDTTHLEKWVNRNIDSRDILKQMFNDSSVIEDLKLSVHITHWAYEQAHFSGASVWLRKKELRPLLSDWIRILERLESIC